MMRGGRLSAALGATGRLPRAAVAIGMIGVLAAASPLDRSEPPPLPEEAAQPRAPAADAALARPLFDPGRRAWTARGDLSDVVGTPAPAARLRVRGILIDGSARRALIDDGIGDPAWVAEGAGRGAWRLIAIAPDRVTLADGAGTLTAEFLGEPVSLRPPRRARSGAPALRTSLGPSP
ncbi:hypothetical protein [Methylobacterium segetis]|uniref:hypothetical protein n=1 Tax=Methylobacterium segetis TaxID=2488750 RepID=UPI00105254EA|nr:hypothetical protein [Methylobacterium segetis]